MTVDLDRYKTIKLVTGYRRERNRAARRGLEGDGQHLSSAGGGIRLSRRAGFNVADPL